MNILTVTHGFKKYNTYKFTIRGENNTLHNFNSKNDAIIDQSKFDVGNIKKHTLKAEISMLLNIVLIK